MEGGGLQIGVGVDFGWGPTALIGVRGDPYEICCPCGALGMGPGWPGKGAGGWGRWGVRGYGPIWVHRVHMDLYIPIVEHIDPYRGTY